MGDTWLNMSILLVLLLLRNIFSVFFVFCFVFWTFFSNSFCWQSEQFCYQSETIVAKQFVLNFNYCFLFLVRYCLKTCVNCVANCVTQKFTPLRSEFYIKKFSMSFYGQLRQLFHIYEPILSKQFFSKLEFLFSVLGSMVSKNICKLRHKLKNAKNLPELTWSWQKKILIYVVLSARVNSF